MIRTVQKAGLTGTVQAPPSKSMAHRLLICAALAKGESVVRGVDLSQDVQATVDCLCALGAKVRMEGKDAYVTGMDVRTAAPKSPLCCRESGSTLRFMIPLALLCGQEVRLTGSETLLSRPLSVYEDLAKVQHFRFEKDALGVTVQGPIQRGYMEVPGDVSSQFITGLLFALPLLQGDRMGSRLRIRKPIESRSYIDLTLSALKQFGVRWIWEDDCTLITFCDQSYQPTDVTVEGDESNAAFFHALRALGHDVAVTGLSADTLQGDRVCKAHLDALKEGPAVIDLQDCPDLGPVLMMAAAALHGAEFRNTRRLRIKESDRAMCMAQELKKCGGCVTVEENRVIVHKAPLHAPKEPILGYNDHRIVMAMSVLLTTLGGHIDGAEAVSKSYPGFFEEIEKLTR